ncbi:MAG: nucleotide exchange factor GrpE [Anaerolineales bacterium]|nr:nucleotide exchange factor GrpE [Anaerolineales bacterium]
MEEEKDQDPIENNEESEGEEMESGQGAVGVRDSPIDPEAVAQLQVDLAECIQKREEYLDGWQRSRADFANLKKRVEREQAEANQRAASRAATRFMEVMDDLELALKDRPADGEGASWAAGIDLIYRKILGFFEADGIVRMDAQGAQFDPNFHEAIATEDNDEFESGQIIEVLQAGYMQNDKVIRPARVRVAN